MTDGGEYNGPGSEQYESGYRSRKGRDRGRGENDEGPDSVALVASLALKPLLLVSKLIIKPIADFSERAGKE